MFWLFNNLLILNEIAGFFVNEPPWLVYSVFSLVIIIIFAIIKKFVKLAISISVLVILIIVITKLLNLPIF